MKNKERMTGSLFTLVFFAAVIVIVVFIFNFRMTGRHEAIKVGAVFIGVDDDKGWNESHSKGIGSACEKHSCIYRTQMHVPEEEEPLKKAVAELVSEGCSVIFLTSYGYGQYADSIAKSNPDVAFYCISGDYTAENCMSYFARMYQARYLSGIVAGACTKSGILGYVSAMPIPETIRSVNAYALGARASNPSAKVLVMYTGSWDDRQQEEAATRELADAGADVMTFHEDRPYAIDLADEMGLMTTGYDYVSKEYSDRFLTAAVFNWDMLYERVLGDYLSGRANFSNDYWLGLSEGAVSLYPYSYIVTDTTKSLVAAEEERIKTWRDVFSGKIVDNTGTLRCGENERIGDDELFNHIDWYVEGVEIYE
ncbi:MAG: BMP family ABC transporter substrate-binding protein [Lachnospiraceae bacterium]|nr:BMP family ABC transporter substrate-binding protein [Lachnospiraceae bacterium]